ncbi:stage V sporulation protein B [Ruminiclostridium sufflavum DSM 19573]|uniref:Stage V sporulation protein B n=1 Tax=Ruminiclostridium sufflavum DSM 19573 TaxID=1121337 RepID=A0A318XMZ8_9FIRM|nr:stage V sporulation protein B [Ruminiclostridium sufflavum]PYG88209.1 stage V sporulation protein B [Ruminiclostridium sufflavum DSM 19573]
MTKKTFITGAIILMIAGFISRVIGFLYRIYLSNLIGAEGMGLYQLIVPIYTLIILTLTSGVSIAVSKMTAEQIAKGNSINIKRISKIGLFFVLAAGTVVSSVLYANINFFVNEVLKDSRTYLSVIIMLPCIPFIAAASAYKGYFYGIQDVTPTAVSQIVEQLVKIGIVITLASQFLKAGLEYACALATLAMAIGEMSNLLVLAVCYKYKKYSFSDKNSVKGKIRKRKLVSLIFGCAAPISFNRFLISVMAAVEVILIPQRLLEGGLNYIQCMEEYGKLMGMAMPLILFPELVTTSLATTLVPAISESISLKNFNRVNYRISKSIQITMVLGFVFMALFACYPNKISDLIYPGQNIGGTLFLLSFTCIFLYLQQILMGVMNGLGKQGLLLANSIAGSVIRILFVYFLIPEYGLPVYIIGMIISSLIICILNFITIVKNTGMVLDLRHWVLLPAAVTVVLFIFGKNIYGFFSFMRLNASVHTLFAIAAYIIIALFLMALVGVINWRELLQLLGLKNKRVRKFKKY